MIGIVNFLVGLGLGILSGFGIGGGSLLIVYLTMFAGVNQYTAGGINLLYFLFCAPAALVSHIREHRIHKPTLWWCTIAGVAASVLAAVAASVIEVSLLRRIFGVYLLYIGVKELFCKSPAKHGKADSEGIANKDSSSNG